jgi:hypothetical protein
MFIFMSYILFCHGYATKYVIMNGIKKLKKRILLANHPRITRVKPRIVRNIESNLIFFTFVITNEQYA